MLSKLINWMKPLPDTEIQLKDEKQIANLYKFWRIRMFLGMYIGYIVYYFTRKNLSFVATAFMRNVGITKMEFGILNSLAYISYGVGKFLSGIFADKCSIRTFMALGLIGSSIINLFFGFLYSLPFITFFWGINGGLQSMGFPPVAKGLVYWFSPSERATKWTLWSSSHTVGTFLIGILAAWCIGLGDWRATFYVPGIIGLITGIVLLFTLTDKPSSLGLPPIDIYHNDTLPLKKQTKGQKSLSHMQILFKYVLFNPFLWSLAIAYTFIYFIRFATLDWGTVFMTERGLSEKNAAFLLGFMPLIGTLGGISSGWISDKFFKGRCAPISIIYLLCLIFSLWGMYHFTNVSTPWWLIALFLSLVGFFVDGPQNLVGGVQVSRITVQESIGAACGFTGMFGYLGAFLSGIGAAWIIEKWGWHGIFISCGIFCVMAILFIIITWKRENTKPILNQ
ncbi:MAG: MFS transporter [Endomicrobium sp.]|jgi:sugar phosphate permease|nr:MFS transporter [Endomicrobium sp.]